MGQEALTIEASRSLSGTHTVCRTPPAGDQLDPETYT